MQFLLDTVFQTQQVVMDDSSPQSLFTRIYAHLFDVAESCISSEVISVGCCYHDLVPKVLGQKRLYVRTLRVGFSTSQKSL